MFPEHVDPYFRLLKNGVSWHDLVKSDMGPSSVSAITRKIYVKLIKNKADSTISYTKESYGPKKLGRSVHL